MAGDARRRKYSNKLKYGIWIDIRYCFHSLFEKKKGINTFEMSLPQSSGYIEQDSWGVA
jgi:hypothetical protein